VTAFTFGETALRGTPLRGIIPATVLPMTQDYQIDEPGLRRYIAWLIEQGVAGLAINADTGEGPHLSPAERMRVLTIVADEVSGRVPIIAGLGASYTAQAVELARQAQAAGADALLVFPIPAFQGLPLDPEVPYRYHAAIADAVDIPLILFQLQPALGGCLFSREALIRLVKIESVIAMKEASFDAIKFLETKAVLEQVPRQIMLLTGNDNFILGSFVLGAEGALIGFGTLATAMQAQMVKAWHQGDLTEAFRLGQIIQPLADAIFAQPVRNYRARMKEALVMLGILYRATVRPPLLPVSDAERQDVRRALQRAGLLG
jgi:dihydrodipicolinate synthase/N-acetylneuraminate lyase